MAGDFAEIRRECFVDHSNLPVHVQDWIRKIEEHVVTNPDLLMEYCDKLEQYAGETHSNYLKGYSMFFRGYGYYAMSRLEESMTALTCALNELIGTDDWFMTARTYNSMGNIADFQGDLSLAIDCYCKGLSISKEHGLDMLIFSISSNLSSIHISLGQLDHAVDMLLSCEERIGKGLEVAPHSKMAIIANLTACYIRLNRLTEAEKYLEMLRHDFGDSPADAIRVILCILTAELYHKLGDIRTRDTAIAELDGMELQSNILFDALNELCRHARLLLELEKFDEFLALLGQIESRADSPNVEKTVLDLRMKYYQKIGDQKAYEEIAVKFHEVNELREHMKNKIIAHNIVARMYLDEESARRKEIEMTHLLLKQKSERDALTGMNNRYKLNELSELVFHRAYVSGTPLTVEILDIDCYKEFNDNYGHQAGDDCLVRLAEAIRSMEEYPNVYTARYGGDEFVILYEGYARDDVERMARLLQNKVHALNIEHKYSKVSDRVTISQGLFHRIPSGGNKPWDFLYCADMALYGVKKRSKNSYYIGSSLAEVRQYSKQEF